MTLPGALRQLARQVRQAAKARLVVDVGGEVDRTVLLSSTGRSGSTWIADVINADNHYRYLFEPFHPDYTPACRAFGYRQYLRPSEDAPALRAAARHVLTGRVRSYWTNKFNRKLIARRRLIKDVRTNLLLGWMRRHFPEVRIVLLLRHPCAVAHSQLKLGWREYLDEHLADGALMADHLEPFRRELERNASPFRRRVVQWCVETCVPLRQLGPDDVHLAFYEHFCTDGAAAAERLFAFLDRPVPSRVPEMLNRPSVQVWSGSAISRGRNPVEAWREQVSPEQLRDALEILRAFGLDGIYSADPLPDTAAAERMLADRT